MKFRIVYTLDAAAVFADSVDVLRRLNNELHANGIQESVGAAVEIFSTVDVSPQMVAHLGKIIERITVNLRAKYPGFDVEVRAERIGGEYPVAAGAI